MSRRARLTILVAFGLVALPRVARASEPPSVDEVADDEVEADEVLGPRGNLRTRAEQVSFDPQEKVLELSGNVRLDGPPFHLRSERIRLTRTRYGIEIEGKGTLAFCPCLGNPLRVDFQGAIVAPPGDLILEKPTLRFYDVPVLPLPWFWLRSDEKLGLLPPDLAYRGQDGMFVGGGAHVPWKSHGQKLALDLRSGAYLEPAIDGFAIDARLRTPVSQARVRFDRLPGAPAPALPGTPSSTDEGVLVDARGATHDDDVTVAWDVDAIRGRRGVAATTELDAAAKPWDTATGTIILRPKNGPVVVSSGVRAVSRRGGGPADFDAIGPIASVRASDALFDAMVVDATVEGGALRVASPLAGFRDDTLSFARAELGAAASASAGPLGASLSARGAADVGAGERDHGTDRAGAAQLHVGAPLARALDDDSDPWVHVVEPFGETATLHASGDGLLGTPVGRGVSSIDGTAQVARGGLATSLGRWGKRTSIDLVASGGAAFGAKNALSDTLPLARARLAASTTWVGLSGDGAAAFGGAATEGFAAVARGRLGSAYGLRLITSVASRAGIDPVLARLLTDTALEPPGGFLGAEATTGNATLVIPWAHAVTTTLGADGDATREELVGARAGIELRDRCGCLTLRMNGAHRIGREGVDVWLALDFAANR